MFAVHVSVVAFYTQNFATSNKSVSLCVCCIHVNVQPLFLGINSVESIYRRCSASQHITSRWPCCTGCALQIVYATRMASKCSACIVVYFQCTNNLLGWENRLIILSCITYIAWYSMHILTTHDYMCPLINERRNLLQLILGLSRLVAASRVRVGVPVHVCPHWFSSNIHLFCWRTKDADHQEELHVPYLPTLEWELHVAPYCGCSCTTCMWGLQVPPCGNTRTLTLREANILVSDYSSTCLWSFSCLGPE